MTQKTSPFLEGKYGWTYGENGWNSGMDENLLKFSYLFDSNIDSVVSSLPPAVNGKSYFLTTDNRIYYVVDGVYYSTPVPKWFLLTDRSTGNTYQFDGTLLVSIDSPTETDARVTALEGEFATLGTAAFQNVAAFVQTTDAYNTSDLAKGSAIFGRAVQTVESIIQLRLLDKTSNAKTALVTNYYATSKGGGGIWVLDTSDTTSVDNGGTTIVAADGGRWKLSQNSPVSVKQFGAVCDGVADDSAAFNNFVNSIPSGGAGVIYMPVGRSLLTQPINITNRSVMLVGESRVNSILDFRGCDGIVYTGNGFLTVEKLCLISNGNGAYTGIKYNVGAAKTTTYDTLRVVEVDMFGLVINDNYWAIGLHIGNTSATWTDRLSVFGHSQPSAPDKTSKGVGIKIENTSNISSTGHHFTKCTLNFLNIGALLISTGTPAIEGIRFSFCGMVGVGFGLVADATASGYFPPLVTFKDSHIDLDANTTNPIGISIRKFSQVEIAGSDIYVPTDNGVAVQMTNVNRANINNNFFICNGTPTNTTGILIDTSSISVTSTGNNFAGPFAQGFYVLAGGGSGHRSIEDIFAGVVNPVLDGTAVMYRKNYTSIRARMTVAQSLTTATRTRLSFNAASPNFGGGWVVGTPTRLTVPNNVRRVRISGNIRFATNSTGARTAALFKNGAFFTDSVAISCQASTGEPTDLSFTTAILDVTAGDYFEIDAYQNSGGALNVGAPAWVDMEIIDYWT